MKRKKKTEKTKRKHVHLTANTAINGKYGYLFVVYLHHADLHGERVGGQVLDLPVPVRGVDGGLGQQVAWSIGRG